MLPLYFVGRYSGQLSNSISLLIPDRCLWHLGLKKEGESVCTNQGFQKFMDMDIILLFYYNKQDPVFDVCVFDLTCC